MSALPRSSPWGAVQKCEEMIDGVFSVSTASHGGIMVRYAASEFLSSEALKCGFRANRSFCFEQDSCEQVVIRELLDKNLWQIPDHISDKAKYEENINRSLMQRQPEYWAGRSAKAELLAHASGEERQKLLAASGKEHDTMSNARKPTTLAERLEAGKDKAAAHNSARQTPDTPLIKKEATEH